MSNNEPQWLTEREQCAWRNYLRATSQLATFVGQDLFAAFQITLAKYEVLVRLTEADDGQMRMSELAGDLVSSRSRLTRTVSSMEDAGLVEREACTKDRRGRLCRITPEGRALLERMAPVHVASVRRHLLDKIGHEKLMVLGDIMAELIDEDATIADL